MPSFSFFRSIPLNYVKFTPVLNRSRLSKSFNFLRTCASLRSISKAFLITRTYQSSPETLKVEFNDGLSTDLHYAWLRDSCKCKQCLHPISQQKLFDITSVKLDIIPRFCKVTEKGDLKIVWLGGDDEHISLYNPYWLHRYALGFENNLYEMIHDILPPISCWTGITLEQNHPEKQYEDIMQSNTVLNRSLEIIHKYGILFVRDVPCVPGEVVKVMNRIANVTETRWGASFHIMAEEAQHNPACTNPGDKITHLHTDMNYLEKSPGIQAIHCLEAICKSHNGDTAEICNQSKFVDGFSVAEWLKKNFPMYFNTLASVPVKFRLVSQDMEYFNYQPILRLSRSRNITEVNFNNRLMAPLEGPSNSILDFYAAYKLFAENLNKPKNVYSFSFRPGDLVIINNRRVLHGGYKSHFCEMQRHFEGCFADFDEVHARYRSFLMKQRANTEK